MNPRRGVRRPSEGVFGPHFYYDLIRLARRGWPTLARVLFLVVLLISLAVMYRTQGDSVAHARPAEFAVRAQAYATVLIAIQGIMILVLLPVYVASSIAEEKENQTLEALTLTHLTDRELVLGKLGARVMHLGMIVFSSVPILAFMHLWGNVDLTYLIYHELNAFLLLVSAGSLCIWISTHAESVFQAVSRSYPWLALMGVFGVGGAFALPWIIGGIYHTVARLPGSPEPIYELAIPIMAPLHMIYAWNMVRGTITRMEYLRKVEKRGSKKATGAFTLSDNPVLEKKPGKRGQVKSRIHPLAWPIVGDAIFWKEWLKDGTRWSLTYRWALIALGVLPLIGAIFRSMLLAANHESTVALRGNAYSFSFTSYFVSLAAFAMVMLFQTTMSVAGEREHGTLPTLLLVPESRRRILFAKWIGPWWRNWPILAIAYLGVVLGLACGIYGFWVALFLLAAPLPILWMLSGLALWLSTISRRVLFANTAIVGILGVLAIAHAALGHQTQMIASFYIAVVGEMAITSVMKDATWFDVSVWALGELALFLVVGGIGVLAAFRKFAHRDYTGH
jgi:ABC-type transport system involved in multi-copper enzyme maturation permease subunit